MPNSHGAQLTLPRHIRAAQGTLVAYMTVCVGILWRRYHVAGETPAYVTRALAALILALSVCGMAAGLCSNFHAPLLLRVFTLGQYGVTGFGMAGAV